MHAVSSWTEINPVNHCAYKLCDKPSWELLEIDRDEGASTPLLNMLYATFNVWLMFVSCCAVEFNLIVLSTKIILDAFECVIHKHTLDLETSQFIRGLDLGYSS